VEGKERKIEVTSEATFVTAMSASSYVSLSRQAGPRGGKESLRWGEGGTGEEGEVKPHIGPPFF